VRNNGNLFALQRILGHSDIKVTQLYVGLDSAAVQDAHAKASPVDRLLGG
jgi:site-specific recombinase XerD